MQLTGDRFTSVSAVVRQRPLDAARLPGRDPGAGRHRQRRVGVPGQHRRPQDHDAWRRTERARRDEPGRADGRPAPARAGRHGHRQRRRLRRAQPREGRLQGQPARRRHPGALPRAPGADDQPHQGGLRAARRQAPRRRALEELLRARPGVVHVHPADRPDARLDRREVRRQRAGRGGEQGVVPRRASTSARPPRPSATATRSAGQAARRRVHQHHRQHRARLGHRRRRPARRSCRSPSARTRSPRRRDILHELSKHKHFGIRTVQAEDEIAAIGMALGAAFAGHLGVTTTSGPGVALKSETTSLAISIELPLLLVDIQRGGPSTGLPTKTEAVRPQHRALRPPRRGTAADRRRLHPGALLPRRHRGGPHRAQVPHAGDPAVRRLPGQRLGAVEPAAIDSLPDISVPFTTEPNHVDDEGNEVFWPYLRDETTLARPWAIPGTPGLMHRVGGLEKEDGTGNIDYTPENHERMVHLRAAKIAAHRHRHPADGDQRRRRRRRARPRLGLDLGGHRRRRPAQPAAPARRSPGRTSCTSTRCHPTSATS